MKCTAKTVDEFLSFENLTNCLTIRAVYHVQDVAKLISESKSSLKVWMNELFALDIEKMIRAHLIFLMFQSSRQLVSGYNFKDKRIVGVLELVNKMFAVKHLLSNHSAMYETGFFEKGANLLLEKAFKKLLVDLRPHMLGLVEFFSLGDIVPSVIGNKYGDIYEAQLEAAVNSKLNQQ